MKRNCDELVSLCKQSPICIYIPEFSYERNIDTKIHDAIINHQNYDLIYLINKKANLNAIDPELNYTPLHCAVHYNNEPAVRILIKHKVNLEIKDNEGDTPLHIAIQNSNFNNVMLLIENNADIEAYNDKGNRAIHLAAMNGKIEYVKFLVEKGVDVEAVNNKGFKALDCALKEFKHDKGYIKVIKLLIQSKVNFNKNILELIQIAQEEKDLNLIELLLNSGLNTNNFEHSKNLKDVIKSLIKAKVNFNRSDDTLLKFANEESDIELIELLLSSGLIISKDIIKNYLNKNFTSIPKSEALRLAIIADQLIKRENNKNFTELKELIVLSLEKLFKFKKENNTNSKDVDAFYYDIFSLIKDRIQISMLKFNKEELVKQFKTLHANVKATGLFELYFDITTGKVTETNNNSDEAIAYKICDSYFPSLKLIVIDQLAVDVSNDIEEGNFTKIDATINKLPKDLHDMLFCALNKHLESDVCSMLFESYANQHNEEIGLIG